MAGNISTETTVLSNLSVTGGLQSGAYTPSTISATGAIGGSVVTAATSVNVGGGTAITSILATSLSLSTLTVGALDKSTATLAWTSLTTRHVVSINQTAALTQDYLNLRAWPSAAGVVTIVMNNSGNTQVVQASATLRAVAIKF